MTPDDLGRVVRQAWVEWAREQPAPKPSWLVPWEDLSEADQEADRRIGQAVAAHLFATRLTIDDEDAAPIEDSPYNTARRVLPKPGPRNDSGGLVIYKQRSFTATGSVELETRVLV